LNNKKNDDEGLNVYDLFSKKSKHFLS